MSELLEKWLGERCVHNAVGVTIEHNDIKFFLMNVKGLLFPGYVESIDNLSDYLNEKVEGTKFYLHKLLRAVERLEKTNLDVDKIVCEFLDSMPKVSEIIETDIEAIFEGDPACKSRSEIILCYPGLTAIFTYRIAHVLYELKVPSLPRILTEFAHSKTGIDIHPGAQIDSYFFIDHGTGIVIGETCIIGKHVKVYQGVTLGALSLRKGHDLSGVKRHPTIMDNVTIYSGASIFGGNTIIGKNATIGSNAFITESVEDDMTVTITGEKKHKGEVK
jgi:serine O-acetyltransferase